MNAPDTRQPFEAVGARYDAAQMLVVRDRTLDAVKAIAAAIAPGMVEEDAVELAKDILAERGMLRGWHGVFVRFGKNTIKSCSEASEPGVVLGDDDLFFIDIGPTWKNLEGDGGDTFVTGTNADMARCAADARAIFHAVRQRWLASGDSGKVLYEFARSETERRGWTLNMELSGHRITDFPHAAAYNGTLAEIDFCPAPLLWVLEIHIRHPQQTYGAFFEDLLLDDSYFA
ncbi:MAG: M24 family metallopeptidase [Pseudomonadota bacterium]